MLMDFDDDFDDYAPWPLLWPTYATGSSNRLDGRPGMAATVHVSRGRPVRLEGFEEHGRELNIVFVKIEYKVI